jgi:hypothetical protein
MNLLLKLFSGLESLILQKGHQEAERIHRQTLELGEKVLRVEHPAALTSMGNFRDRDIFSWSIFSL